MRSIHKVRTAPSAGNQRHLRVRHKVTARLERPRLVVFRSSKHIYASWWTTRGASPSRRGDGSEGVTAEGRARRRKALRWASSSPPGKREGDQQGSCSTVAASLSRARQGSGRWRPKGGWSSDGDHQSATHRGRPAVPVVRWSGAGSPAWAKNRNAHAAASRWSRNSRAGVAGGGVRGCGAAARRGPGAVGRRAGPGRGGAGRGARRAAATAFNGSEKGTASSRRDLGSTRRQGSSRRPGASGSTRSSPWAMDRDGRASRPGRPTRSARPCARPSRARRRMMRSRSRRHDPARDHRGPRCGRVCEARATGLG